MNALQQVTSGQYGSNLSVTFGYNSYGYPTSTVAGTIQNYSYNFNSATGNLNWRQNNKYTGLKEDIYYDGLDRLDYIMKGTTTTLDMAYHYDKGGIFTKSDVGSFLYNNTLKPYALSEISPTSMIIPNSVDSLTYTSFESVKTIQEDPYSASFVYNADNGRAKMEVKQNTTTILTRWYPENSYIKETASGTTREYTFIGGDAYTSPVVAITQSGTTTYYNLLRDHLGSITHVVNASTNTLVYQYSYDAWGRMRNVSTWNNYSPGSEPALFIAGRGFTGHEHLPWFNLINMLSEGMVNEVKWVGAKSRERSDSGNGRMYDPIAGQFLSPDPFMQNPYLTQNFNRYSYCVNNPLKFLDPTGNNYYRDPATIGLSAHEQIYGPNSHIDELWRERFGLMYNDVFQSGGPNNSQPQKVWVTTNDIYGNKVTILVPAKTIDGRWLPLGLNKPTLWVNEKKVNNPVFSNFEGYYSMHIQVYGEMYSDYNWVQTVSGISDGKYNIGVDNRGVFNPGFYYSEMQKKDYKSTYQGDANMFFYDEPNFTDFNAELTLFGKKEGSWEIIQSFSWGYSVNSETTGKELTANWFPSLFHRIMTNWTLFRSNNWF